MRLDFEACELFSSARQGRIPHLGEYNVNWLPLIVFLYRIHINQSRFGGLRCLKRTEALAMPLVDAFVAHGGALQLAAAVRVPRGHKQLLSVRGRVADVRGQDALWNCGPLHRRVAHFSNHPSEICPRANKQLPIEASTPPKSLKGPLVLVKSPKMSSRRPGRLWGVFKVAELRDTPGAASAAASR
jgi:hypothetical protein